MRECVHVCGSASMSMCVGVGVCVCARNCKSASFSPQHTCTYQEYGSHTRFFSFSNLSPSLVSICFSQGKKRFFFQPSFLLISTFPLQASSAWGMYSRVTRFGFSLRKHSLHNITEKSEQLLSYMPIRCQFLCRG